MRYFVRILMIVAGLAGIASIIVVNRLSRGPAPPMSVPSLENQFPGDTLNRQAKRPPVILAPEDDGALSPLPPYLDSLNAEPDSPTKSPAFPNSWDQQLTHENWNLWSTPETSVPQIDLHQGDDPKLATPPAAGEKRLRR